MKWPSFKKEDYIPQKRGTLLVTALFSLVAAATFVVGMHVVRTKWFYSGTWEENYFEGLSVIDGLWLALLFVAFFFASIVILGLIKFLLLQFPVRKKEGNSTLVFCLAWLGIFICWVPYFLVNYPGALYADSIVIMKQGIGILSLSSHHPIAYVGLVNFFLQLGKVFFDSYIMGIAFYTVFQMVFMSAVFAYCLSWMSRHRIPLIVIVVFGIFIALLSIFPLHAVSMWKDGLYAVFVLRFSLLLFDIVESRGKALSKPAMLVQLFLWGSAIALIRSNGIYVMACVWLVLFLMYVWRNWRIIIPVFASVLAVWLVIGPLSTLLEVRTEPVESCGIPLQQVAAVVVYDGEMTPDEQEFLDTLLPLEEYKEEYIPCSVDGIKWAKNFNEDFFNENQAEFMQLWAQLGKANPGIYASAYIMESYEYWSFADLKRNITYNGVNDKYDAPDLGIIETNLLEVWFGEAVGNFFAFRFLHFQEGAMSWMVLFAGLVLFVARHERWAPAQDVRFGKHGILRALPAPFSNAWWIVLLPTVANWLTVLISSPFAALPRYILPAYFLLPVLIVLPWLICAGEDEETAAQAS
ncbi:MAG: hypothetical protein IJ113_05400 [Eggerthellaceae bacterium]|nr:hypothetical protein [Eggerthellaceae bacterium]